MKRTRDNYLDVHLSKADLRQLKKGNSVRRKARNFFVVIRLGKDGLVMKQIKKLKQKIQILERQQK